MMNPTLLTRLANVPRNIKRCGLTGAARLYQDRIHEVLKERSLGIETKSYVTRDKLGYIPEYNQYEPIQYRCLDIMFKHLSPDYENEVFIDYGSGKGRAVIVAATNPFRKVIGVEFSPELCEIARKNVERARKHLKCQEVEIVAMDATKYEVPQDVTLVFLYNPFTGEPLNMTGERIRASLQAAPRRLRIVYAHLESQPNVLDTWPWLRKTADLPMPETRAYDERQSELTWAVYETTEETRTIN